MALGTRLERATLGFEDRCSIQLSYPSVGKLDKTRAPRLRQAKKWLSAQKNFFMPLREADDTRADPCRKFLQAP